MALIVTALLIYLVNQSPAGALGIAVLPKMPVPSRSSHPSELVQSKIYLNTLF